MRQASRRVRCGRKGVIYVADVLPHKEPSGSVMHQGKVLQEAEPQFTEGRTEC
jgi:hypothetical protein